VIVEEGEEGLSRYDAMRNSQGCEERETEMINEVIPLLVIIDVAKRQ
jgi:hypothetical protein